MKRSLLGCLGFFGSYRITAKNNAATMSAAEQQLDGCPLPASVVARTLSIRRVVALFCSAVISCRVDTLGEPILSPFTLRDRSKLYNAKREIGDIWDVSEPNKDTRGQSIFPLNNPDNSVLVRKD